MTAKAAKKSNKSTAAKKGTAKQGALKKAPKALAPANNIESFTGKKRVRRNFGRIQEVAQMPNLIEVQRRMGGYYFKCFGEDCPQVYRYFF